LRQSGIAETAANTTRSAARSMNSAARRADLRFGSNRSAYQKGNLAMANDENPVENDDLRWLMDEPDDSEDDVRYCNVCKADTVHEIASWLTESDDQVCCFTYICTDCHTEGEPECMEC
jgi:hypothetical protein